MSEPPETGGRFCFCITHPLHTAAAFVDAKPGVPFVLRGPFFEERRADEISDRRK